MDPLIRNLTVACVYRSGGVYRAEHVIALAKAVGRFVIVPYRFVCLTNQAEQVSQAANSDADGPVRIETPLLIYRWPKWWSKVELFRAGLFSGPVFYMDLDTVIVEDVTDVVCASYRFAMLRGMSDPTRPGSGIMAWAPNEGLERVFRRFSENSQRVMEEYVTKEKWGDQGWIADNLPFPPLLLQNEWPGRIVSYKIDCRPNGGVPPEGASIVAYHGEPRPWAEPPMMRAQ